MNLNAYDNIKDKINKNKTWIIIKKRLLLSREIKYRKYYTFLKRFDLESQTYDYYIALFDSKIEDRIIFDTKRDDYGRIKIKLQSVFNEFNFIELDKDCNIIIECVDKQKDGEVYKINT